MAPLLVVKVMMNDDGAVEGHLGQAHQRDDEEEEQGDEEDSLDPEPWKSCPSYKTRENTPTKKPPRSACWRAVAPCIWSSGSTWRRGLHPCVH